jgi:hypothetical protein
MTSAAVADCALSRRKQGFESPRERHEIKHLANNAALQNHSDLKPT